MPNSKTVWSSEQGDLRKASHDSPGATSLPPQQQTAYLHRAHQRVQWARREGPRLAFKLEKRHINMCCGGGIFAAIGFIMA